MCLRCAHYPSSMSLAKKLVSLLCCIECIVCVMTELATIEKKRKWRKCKNKVWNGGFRFNLHWLTDRHWHIFTIADEWTNGLDGQHPAVLWANLFDQSKLRQHKPSDSKTTTLETLFSFSFSFFAELSKTSHFHIVSGSLILTVLKAVIQLIDSFSKLDLINSSHHQSEWKCVCLIIKII